MQKLMILPHQLGTRVMLDYIITSVYAILSKQIRLFRKTFNGLSHSLWIFRRDKDSAIRILYKSGNLGIIRDRGKNRPSTCHDRVCFAVRAKKYKQDILI